MIRERLFSRQAHGGVGAGVSEVDVLAVEELLGRIAPASGGPGHNAWACARTAR